MAPGSRRASRAVPSRARAVLFRIEYDAEYPIELVVESLVDETRTVCRTDRASIVCAETIFSATRQHRFVKSSEVVNRSAAVCHRARSIATASALFDQRRIAMRHRDA